MPLELFTVNYDLLLETALDNARATYFDGFVGNIEARFQTELVEALPSSDSETMPPFFCQTLEAARIAELEMAGRRRGCPDRERCTRGTRRSHLPV